ncbi:hypothetical protein [Flavobacterium alkalisoli]|uniref:hypothetical protein n=1 Tax=Flavobacterium alkalisoli TaxID=2602769 RepID=UPI003A928CD9
MEIECLKELELNPCDYIYTHFVNEPISLTEIENPEQLYNNGKPFPKALKELLFLAGKFCYVLDYNIFETQQEMQDYVRELLEEDNILIQRPFFVIDVYNAGTQFLYIYLDEDDNPAVHEGLYYGDPHSVEFTHLVTGSLSKYISSQIEIVKKGQNPF